MQRYCYVLKLQSKSELRTKLFDIHKTVNSLTLNIEKSGRQKLPQICPKGKWQDIKFVMTYNILTTIRRLDISTLKARDFFAYRGHFYVAHKHQCVHIIKTVFL